MAMTKSVLWIVFAGVALAQTQDVERAMRESEAAWNRGDLPAFASYYDDSPETTFIGREVTRGGVQAILDRYRRGYPTREAMGTLTFSELEVRPLAEGVALMTGRFALKRTAAGGGDASGRFTLIWKRTPAGWKIIHDHTS
jgi:ketosteroid isomerase-like protein